MTIVERVTTLHLPLDDIVVIGSGLLDALGLRKAHDIDLAVSEELFAHLKKSDNYVRSLKHGEEVLEKDGVEIWRSWGILPDEQFDALQSTGSKIGGVMFCSPEMIIRHKKIRGTQKDLHDIASLQAYVAKHPDLIS